MEEWTVEGLVGGAGEARERGSRGRGWEAGSRSPLRLGQFLGLVRSWPPVLIGELFLMLLVFTLKMVDNRSLDEKKIFFGQKNPPIYICAYAFCILFVCNYSKSQKKGHQI